MASRSAVAWIAGAPHILVSDLSAHTTALNAHAVCSLLLGKAGPKGDALTHPRITLQCTAHAADKIVLRDDWLRLHPKSKLYFDFTDFRMMRLHVEAAFLNGGLGKAFHLSAEDLSEGQS